MVKSMLSRVRMNTLRAVTADILCPRPDSFCPDSFRPGEINFKSRLATRHPAGVMCRRVKFVPESDDPGKSTVSGNNETVARDSARQLGLLSARYSPSRLDKRNIKALAKQKPQAIVHRRDGKYHVPSSSFP